MGFHPSRCGDLHPQGADDPVYAEADAAVTAETVKSILGTELGYQDVPNFMFTYMTGVDEAGHLYGVPHRSTPRPSSGPTSMSG